MNDTRITEADIETQRAKERAKNAAANAAAWERIWRALRTLFGWMAGLSLVLALGYDMFLKAIGRR